MDMRTAALTAMLLIRTTDRHNRSMDSFMQRRLGHEVTQAGRMPVMDAVYTCMDAMAGNLPQFDLADRAISMAAQVIRNAMATAQFDIV